MKKRHYLFTSESVSKGHPDKVADQISDALLDEFLRCDRNSKVACETFCTTGLVVVGGEVKTEGYVDVQETVRDTIKCIGYTKGEYKFSSDSCGVMSTIHEQSPDINRGVEREEETKQGAGDQGIMFGYATDETKTYMPLTYTIANGLLQALDELRETGVLSYLRPDAKSQVTIEYDEHDHPVSIDTVLISTQHDDMVADGSFPDDDAEHSKIEWDICNVLIPHYVNSCRDEQIVDIFRKGGYRVLVNPTGKFVIGGPHGDTGLTGRKIIVDTYGGWGAHGGGAFSGKDPSKVDRSAAYAARHIAKNLVAAGTCKRCLVQLSYAIGVAKPVSVYVNTYGTVQHGLTDYDLSVYVDEQNLTPYSIINRLQLRNPIYRDTAAYGHFGKEPYRDEQGHKHYTWEELDLVDDIKRRFNIQ